MKTKILGVRPFIYVCLLFLLISLLNLLFVDYDQMHYNIYNQHTSLVDFFFKYATNLGDGLFAVSLLLLICWFKPLKYFWLGVLSFAISGLLAQFIKKVIAPSALRPIKVYSMDKLHLIDGVLVNSYHSFPSGHTATAFALFMFLAYVFHKNTIAQIGFALLAVIVGFSRIYLTQHFLLDVLFGALFGILSYFIAFYITEKWQFRWYNFTLKNAVKRNREISMELSK